MSNDRNNSESPRIADGAFEAFIENELLPQVGLSRSAFDNLLNQLNITSLSENLGVQPLPSQPVTTCLLYTSPSPRDQRGSRMPSSA